MTDKPEPKPYPEMPSEKWDKKSETNLKMPTCPFCGKTWNIPTSQQSMVKMNERKVWKDVKNNGDFDPRGIVSFICSKFGSQSEVKNNAELVEALEELLSKTDTNAQFVQGEDCYIHVPFKSIRRVRKALESHGRK